MPTPISLLYQALTSRDIDAVRPAVIAFRSKNSAQALLEAVSRFAVLSCSPSQHGKHAVIACRAAFDLREELADHYEQILAECAIYAAQSRLPWSEPPITDPPAVGRNDPFSDDELREAVAARDQARAIRWLARRMREPALERSFFQLASEDLSDQGHKLILATTAWQLARLLGEQGTFATLRLAVVEWAAYGEPQAARSDSSLPTEEALRRLINALVEEGGSTIAFHRVALFDAALTAEELSGLPIVRGITGALMAELGERVPEERALDALPRAPVYALSRDYAEYLQAYAIARRLQSRFPSVDTRRILSAAKFNLDHGPSFEDWSFA